MGSAGFIATMLCLLVRPALVDAGRFVADTAEDGGVTTPFVVRWNAQNAACSLANPQFQLKADVGLRFGPQDEGAVFRMKLPGWWSTRDISYFDGINKAILTVGTNSFKMDVLHYRQYKASASGSCTDISGFHQQCEKPVTNAGCEVAAKYVRGDLPVQGTGGSVTTIDGYTGSVNDYPQGCFVHTDGKFYLNAGADGSTIGTVYCDCRNGVTTDTDSNCKVQAPQAGTTKKNRACCTPGQVCVFSDERFGGNSELTGAANDCAPGASFGGKCGFDVASATSVKLELSPSLGLRLPAEVLGNSTAYKISVNTAKSLGSAPLVDDTAFTRSPNINMPGYLNVANATAMVISESKDDNTLTFRLTSPPSANVGLVFASESFTDRLQLGSPTLTFTPGNYYIPQALVLNPIRNFIQDGDALIRLVITPTRYSEEDLCFTVPSLANARGSVPIRTLDVTVVDDDIGTDVVRPASARLACLRQHRVTKPNHPFALFRFATAYAF